MIELSLPFQGSHRISQEFGENPETYLKFGIPGHEGIDWAMPEGTPVLATDDGRVGLITTTGAYGNAIRLHHAWGHSVSAHLSKILVRLNQNVRRGEVIALSGNTGRSTGPHLHYGMRVAPFLMTAPWWGYCNPKRYFQPSPYLLGPHIMAGNGSMLDTLKRWQPKVALVLNPDPGFVSELKRVSPDTKIIGRIYKPDSEVADHIKRDPVEAARWMHELVLGHSAYKANAIDYWQIANEVCQHPWEDFVKLNTTMNEWIKLATTYKCALFSFSVGNPEAPINDPGWWNHVFPTLQRAEKNGHILLVHEYGCCPDVMGPIDAKGKPATAWYAQRFVQQVRPYLLPRNLQVVVGEFGYDGLICNPKPSGWKTAMKASDYAAQLIAMNHMYADYRDNIMGVCVFTYGTESPDWTTYDITGHVVETLANFHNVPVTTPDLGQTLMEVAANNRPIRINPQAALFKKMKLSGYVPTGNEFTATHKGNIYIAQVAENSDTGSPSIFYVPVGDWTNVSKLDI